MPILRRPILGQEYYWLTARHLNRLVILGPKMTAEDANEFGYLKMEGIPFEVIGLPTRNRARARELIMKRAEKADV